MIVLAENVVLAAGVEAIAVAKGVRHGDRRSASLGCVVLVVVVVFVIGFVILFRFGVGLWRLLVLREELLRRLRWAVLLVGRTVNELWLLIWRSVGLVGLTVGLGGLLLLLLLLGSRLQLAERLLQMRFLVMRSLVERHGALGGRQRQLLLE